ncbi:winged helix-turn-helix domain-containing protein [Ferrimonas balearica]|nr:helix-turn-helix domain-containing protein [Ferrimonas balearica]
MPLGSVTFHRQQGVLERTEDGERWQLPRAEFLVLTQLLDHPGIPLSKQRLRCGGEPEPVMSGSAVVKAVFTLRHFIGDEATTLIQTVPGKGYRLVMESGQRPEQTRQTLALGRTSQPVAMVVIGLMALVAALLWWWPMPPAISPIPPKQNPMPIMTASNQPLELVRVSGMELDQDLLNSLRIKLASTLKTCRDTPWKRVYLARSNDGQVLNLTFEGEVDGRPRLRNIKISDFRSEPTFLSSHWLEEANLCE